MPEGSLEFRLHTAEIHQCRLTPCDDVDIHRRKRLPAASEDFPGITLDPVADYGVANLFADRDPETGLSQIIRLPDNKEALGIEFVWSVKKPDKVRTLPKP
ncbi:hypothetical protein GSbR_14780 [Geobacter sp. SVR]|nr:hypothetical protein GSVR_44230 [Geobacter sp. SVR]GCF84878.1 hypothetical protein GSbR_14780 [Geobacter sp. SVR]